MFKERSTDKLIEYIQGLPETEQKLIVKTIGKKQGKSVVATVSQKKRKSKYQAMEVFLRSHRGTLPKNFKFNREYANAR